MNCSQARAMMAAYRELDIRGIETIELDIHLESCESCRQELVRQMFVGEQLRALPAVEPLPDMHTKLMHALAEEQLEFMRRSPGTIHPPEFLKPYLHEHVQSTQTSHQITAFSTAETGPLPIIQAKHKPRHRSHMNQFAVLGLAAAFLMLLMMGGLTSLLLLAHNNPQIAKTNNNASALLQPTIVEQAKYTTTTPYTNVASAVADRTAIYYTAYGDALNPTWMLERLDRATNISTSLLPEGSVNPLILLGTQNGALVWLQFDGLKLKPHANLSKYGFHPYVSLWSLHYLSLQQQQQILSGIPTGSDILLQGTFDQDTAPSWVTTPIQGIWFMQKSLLVAMTDSKGISHLINYPLDTVGKAAEQEIATALPGHELTSPTANSDGTQIYWSEEWLSASGVLSSNIWTQQVVDASPPMHGRWAPHTDITMQAFTSDGMSFRPQVVNNTLFMLSTASQNNSDQGTSTPTETVTPQASPSPNANAIARTVTSVYAAPLDASVRGSVLMIPLDDPFHAQPTVMNNTGLASSLQVGTNFALWQGDKGYEMYDVAQKSDVSVGSIFDGSTFLAVNGSSAVWMLNNTSDSTNNTNASITLMAFNWPGK
ncbi:MAG TPA: zf-HC2 domain-containing protein [Ktedonobacteraceae bacterium]|nr:zf-HC2 domain-containing protein [Ktedonobacteraceae bacterium]